MEKQSQVYCYSLKPHHALPNGMSLSKNCCQYLIKLSAWKGGNGKKRKKEMKDAAVSVDSSAAVGYESVWADGDPGVASRKQRKTKPCLTLTADTDPND